MLPQAELELQRGWWEEPKDREKVRRGGGTCWPEGANKSIREDEWDGGGGGFGVTGSEIIRHKETTGSQKTNTRRRMRMVMTAIQF